MIPSAVELGLRWRSLISGYVAGVRFFKGPLNTGVHTGSLWTNTGTLMATVTFTNETASGWQEALFSSPVLVEAISPYVVLYHTATGRYSADFGSFQGTGVVNEPLEALANGVSGGNGVYRTAGWVPDQHQQRGELLGGCGLRHLDSGRYDSAERWFRRFPRTVRGSRSWRADHRSLFSELCRRLR